MKALEYASDFDMPDRRVAVCGDWHGNVGWTRTLARAIPALAPDVTTILQLGDWWIDPEVVDEVFSDTSISRIFVTLGNHEPWDQVTPLLDANAGSAVRVSEITWLLPRPGRLTIGGRTVLSLGGAASVDRLWRIEGAGWWRDEAITDVQVAEAIAGGPADLMLTHESPARTPVRAVREVLRTNPMGFPNERLAESMASRDRVKQVWDAVRPELLMHGHMHVAGGGATDDGRRVASFGRDTMQGSLAFLDLQTLRLEVPTVQQMRKAAFPDG
ncbi:metallophosphoesterase [Microbacterium sp. ISL-59]|uniref:metallophosphoesterase family protein n=1 Tax=Microbacterium sp. ISL-59 TaxID=2819159 RepID=UPI001BE68246|nr:metallophosphoesterase [Microbacterium sp. ISL-59]MBT2496205.1 metallophosphoesterase [Microbacterium sp. ISL-59]